MSLIDDTAKEIVQQMILSGTESDKEYINKVNKTKSILEKNLKQSEYKLIDDLIEKWKKKIPNHKKLIRELGQDEYLLLVSQGLGHKEEIVKQFISDLENLKQSENVVEIKKYVGLCNCGEESNSKCNYCRNCGTKIKWID